MNLKEVQEKGLLKIRLPKWNKFAYIRLTKLPDGIYGPWAELIDVNSDPIPMLTMSLAGDEWVSAESV